MGDFTSGDQARGIVANMYNAQPGNAVDEEFTWRSAGGREWVWTKAADGAAGTATATTRVRQVGQRAERVRRIRFCPDAGLTANATNFATIIIRTYNAAGTLQSGDISVTTSTTAGGGTGDWTARVPVTLQSAIPGVAGVSSTVLVCPAGGRFEVEITKAASGVVVPAGELIIETEPV